MSSYQHPERIIAPAKAKTAHSDSLAEVLRPGAEVKIADVELHRHCRQGRISCGALFLIAFTLQGLEPARAGCPAAAAVTD
jgi:hypothetical protein